MQGSNRDGDIEHTLVDAKRKERVGQIDRVALKHIQHHMKETDSGNLVYDTGSPTLCSVTS